jgi:hypothetical protein
MVRRYDLGGYSAAPLGATRLVRERRPDESKSSPVCPGFLNSPVG